MPTGLEPPFYDRHDAVCREDTILPDCRLFHDMVKEKVLFPKDKLFVSRRAAPGWGGKTAPYPKLNSDRRLRRRR